MNDLDITIKNLEKIHKELPLLADKIPSIRKEFDMDSYGCYSGNIMGNTSCKTHGCGLGNSARLFDLSNELYYNSRGKFDYMLFSQSILPSLKGWLWQYLFSSEWGESYSEYKTFDHFIERVGNMIKLLKEQGAVVVTYSPSRSNDLRIT